MLELENLEAAAADFEANADLDFVDQGRLSAVVDRLQGVLCRVVHRAASRGDHLLNRQSACSFVAGSCRMSRTAAADRLCVGKQLDKMPKVSEALSTGQIGYQATSVICHLQSQVDEIGAEIGEEMWIANARRYSIKDLRDLAARTWHGVDPEGFAAAEEEVFARRQLFISQTMDRMYRIDGWLDPAGGAALKTAIESLSRPLGTDDGRSPRQRRADAVVELAQHAMDEGRLPRRHGVRPHIAVHTTVEGLKGELGAAASELAGGTPISSKTVQRLACDGTLHRVLKADSMVIDVGRAKRTAQPAQWRGLRARYKTCACPGCDRPIGWTYAHHVDFWEEGGHTNLRKMLPLCFYHHRLVHEGGYQVVLVGDRVEFIPPDRPIQTRRRWGERRWAA